MSKIFVTFMVFYLAKISLEANIGKVTKNLVQQMSKLSYYKHFSNLVTSILITLQLVVYFAA